MVDKCAFHFHFLSILAIIVGILDFEQGQFHQSISGFFFLLMFVWLVLFLFFALLEVRDRSSRASTL